MGLLKTFVFLVIAYYVIRFFSRVVAPFFRAVTEINERQKREDKEYVQVKSTKKPKSVDGEYIEYKEVE